MSPDQTGGSVEVSISGPVARIELSHPGKLNAFTWAMYDQLEQGLARISADRDIRAVIISGRDGAFAAGTDIRQFLDFTTAEDGVEYEHRIGRVIGALAGLEMPVLAMVDGPAVGAGLAVAACADLVIASSRAVFGAPIARTLGNCLPPLVVARLQSRLGAARTMAMLLTSRLISADEAYQAGFVAEICAPDDLEVRSEEIAAKIISSAPITLAGLKEIDRRLLLAGMVDADDVLARCYGSQDFHEGVQAFVEHRKPQWTGR